MTLLGPYLVGCALLLAAGASKAYDPRPTALALSAQFSRLAATRKGVLVGIRLLAAAEAVLGGIGLLFPLQAIASSIAAMYVFFSLYVVYVRRRGGPLATCGCFATPDTPASVLHVVVNLAMAGAATSVAVSTPGGDILRQLVRQPWSGVPLVGSSILGAWLVVLSLGALARLQGTRLSVGASHFHVREARR